MMDGVFYILLFILFAGVAALALWIINRSTGFHPAQILPKKQMRRLALVETKFVDNKRKLLLVRRDDVEHLILTGGPMDMVLESGISAKDTATNGVSDMILRSQNERNGKSDTTFSISQYGADISDSLVKEAETEQAN